MEITKNNERMTQWLICNVFITLISHFAIRAASKLNNYERLQTDYCNNITSVLTDC